ncbi:MAG: chromosomal replication initiator protein DnaA [Cytophagales bacterium]
MNTDHNLLWKSCLAAVEKEESISAQSYKTWFVPIVPSKYEQNTNTLTISIPDKIYYEFIEEHYANVLKPIICKVLGDHGTLHYEIKKERRQQQSVIPKKQVVDYASGHLTSDFTFEHFVVGDCNQLAYAAALSTATDFGKTAINLVMIFGDTGLGKTHLAKAACIKAKEKFPQKKIVYIATESFMAEFIDSILNKRSSNFLKKYSQLDMLVVDDIHVLAGKVKTQEMFFQIFNHLHERNKQIIMTSDRPPSELKEFQKRLLSRFKWGLTVSLQKPKLETRIAIIKYKIKKMKFNLSDDLIHTIATSVTTNIRELEGVLSSLSVYVNLNKQPISQKVLKETIEHLVGKTTLETKISCEYLLKVVANYYQLTIACIKGQARDKDVSRPRQLVMYLCRKYTEKTFRAIGKMLGGRDHSTVKYGNKKIRGGLKKDGKLRAACEEIEEIIKRNIRTEE